MTGRDAATVTPSASAETSAPAAVQSGGARFAEYLLTGTVILGSLAISAGAAWVSFLAIRDLALFFGWDRHTAWIVMPLIELFLLVGSAEAALRLLLDRFKMPVPPYVAAYSALVATLACNIGDHVLRLLDAQPKVDAWRVVILGAFAALVPTAQIGALHFLSGCLRRIAEGRRTRNSAPKVKQASILGQIASAAGERVRDKVKGAPSVEAPAPFAADTVQADAPAPSAPADADTPDAEPAPSARHRQPSRRPSTVRPQRPSGDLHLIVSDAARQITDAARSNAAELRRRYPDGLPQWQGKPSGRQVRDDMGWSNDKAAPAIRAYLAGADLDEETTA